MYKITINDVVNPKVTEYKKKDTKRGKRIVFKQANGVKRSVLLKETDKVEIEREEQCNESKEQSKSKKS